MKKVVIFTAVLTALFISGCAANKPAQIERVSPCACYDTIIKAG